MFKQLAGTHYFWIAFLVIGGYLAFGAVAAFIPVAQGATIFVNTVLSTMGPLVGWVVKGLFDAPTANKDDQPNPQP
jgi:hypothetical protein